jgi:hypothetical protein
MQYSFDDKLERADKHLQLLNSEIERWMEKHPYTITDEIDPNTSDNVVRLKRDRPIPPSIPLGLHPIFPPVISRVRRLFRPSWGVSCVVVVSCSYQFFRPPFTL